MPGLVDLLAGKTLVKRYRIEEVIGLGGFAAVYRAEDLRLGRPVAVKIITLNPPDPGTRERLRERFEREARAAAALPHHPNVVTVHDFGTDPELGLDFLVMELLQGENLAQRFGREGRPGTDVSLQILREAAEGVAVGHAAGIIHRDVKPGNIFLAEPHGDDPFRVCVLDFGIARIATDDAELTRTLAGENPLTAAYAAPEQVRGEHHLTPAADVFSLGVVGYQLLTGEKPFALGEGRRARGRDPVRPLSELAPGVPPGVAAVIEKAMAEEPGDRYPDAGSFAEALDAAIAEDDHTVIAPAGGVPAAVAGAAVFTAGAASAAAADDDGTVLHPGPAPVAAPVPAPEPAAAPSYRYSTVSRSRGGGKMWLILLPLLLAGAVAVYAFTRRGGSEPPVRSGPWSDTLPDTTQTEVDVAPAPPPAPVAPPSALPPAAAPETNPQLPPPPVQIQPTPGIAPPPSPVPVSPPVVAPPSPRPTLAPPPAPRPSPPAPRPSPPPAPPPSPPPAPAPAPAPPPAPAPNPLPPLPLPVPPPAPPPPRDTIVIPPAPPPPPPPTPTPRR